MTNNIPIIDGHNDTLLDLYNNGAGSRRSFFDESELGHIDLPRAREGGMGGGFFALFAPASAGVIDPANTASAAAQASSRMAAVEHAAALEHTLGMAALMFRIERESGGRAAVVRTVAELSQCLENGTLAMIFHIEGAEAIDTRLNALEVLYQSGLRSIGITWSRSNQFGHGVPFAFPGSPDTGPGLTGAGKDLVRYCDERGIMVDLSHLNEKGFWDVAGISGKPLVATHSGVHAICPATRNLTDAQLDAIRDSGGLVGVNFHVGFLRADGQVESDTPLSAIVQHIDYMVERMGIDHVALGSDFDGATMPAQLRDVAGLPKLMAELRSGGYGDAELRKIAHENWLRVLGDTWTN